MTTDNPPSRNETERRWGPKLDELIAAAGRNELLHCDGKRSNRQDREIDRIQALRSEILAALAPAQPAGGAAQITEEMMQAGYKAYGNSLYHDKGWGNHAADIYRAMQAAAPPPPPADLEDKGTLSAVLDTEETYLRNAVANADDTEGPGIMPGDVEGSFQRIREALPATPKTPDLGPGLSRAAQIVESEEELDGDPPFQMSEMGKQVARAIVRATKKSISRRLADAALAAEHGRVE